VADLRLDGLAASVTVVHHYATGFRDLADFFEKQAQDGVAGRGPENGPPWKAT
jgi:hypothetical protein